MSLLFNRIFKINNLSIFQLTFVLLLSITTLSVGIMSISWIYTDTIRTKTKIDKVQETVFNEQSEELKAQVSIIISYLEHVSKDSMFNSVKKIQNEALDYLESIRFGIDGYVFVNTYEGDALLFNGKKLKQPISMSKLDYPGDLDFYKIERDLSKKPEGGSFKYYFKKLDDNELYPKISYIIGFDQWGWIVGAGDYLDNLDDEMITLETNLRDELKNNLLVIVVIFIICLLVLTIVTYIVAKAIRRQFNKFVTIYNTSPNTPNSDPNFNQIFIRELKDIGGDILRTKNALSEAYTIINRSPAVAFLWKNEKGWPVQYVSENVKQLFGYSVQEFVEKKIYYIDLIHKDDVDRVVYEVDTYSKEIGLKTFVHEPYKIIKKDGAIIWVDDKTFIRRDSTGKITHYEGIVHDITNRIEAENEIKKAYDEIKDLRDKLQAENIFIRQNIKLNSLHKDIIGNSEQIKIAIAKATQVAPTDTTVLLLGETGTGKELFAKGIHNSSTLSDKTLITVNCATIPEQLIESELFGHEKGAFTDAQSKKIGLFEIASGSTIFLDEIAELPFIAQSKLLRVIENKEIIRLGSNIRIKVNVRIIAATNQDLKKMVEEKKFRQDLYYRLNVFPIELPPLRNREGDIPLLIEKFVDYFNYHMGKKIMNISKSDIKNLENYSWPGNVRELRNIIERSMIQSIGTKLVIEIPNSNTGSSIPPGTLEDFERSHIYNALEMTYWKIAGNNGAAKLLGLNPSTLKSKIKKLGIKRPNAKK